MTQRQVDIKALVGEMKNHFWLVEWLNELDIGNVDDVARALKAPDASDDLYHRAIEANAAPGPDRLSSASIIAGRSLDLSGEMVGADGDQLIEEADQLFGTAWHYFDNIMVEGFAPRRYLLMRRDGELDLAKERIRSHCKLLLYLREAGALEGLSFSQKPNPCTKHRDRQQLLDAGLAKIMDDEHEIVAELAQGELLDFLNHGDHFHFEYAHPLLGTRYGHWQVAIQLV